MEDHIKKDKSDVILQNLGMRVLFRLFSGNKGTLSPASKPVTYLSFSNSDEKLITSINFICLGRSSTKRYIIERPLPWKNMKDISS